MGILIQQWLLNEKQNKPKNYVLKNKQTLRVIVLFS